MESAVPQPDCAGLESWVIEQGLCGRPHDELLAGFCRRLRATGHPMSRASVSLRTLHPDYGAHTFIWEASNDKISREPHLHGTSESEEFLQSPINYLVSGSSNLIRCRLDGRPLEFSFPIVEHLREQGYSDYAAKLVKFAEQKDFQTMAGIFFSCATHREGGFSDRDLEISASLLPALALAFKAVSVQQVAVNIVEAYLGSDAGHQVLRGRFQRGSVETVDAVILFADLRGFTAAAELLPKQTVVDRLNGYFDCIVLPVEQHGGQVLKFLGDGLLAIFALNGERGVAEVCRAALKSAAIALAQIDGVNRGLEAQGEKGMALDIALHLGDVMYGNVGAADRLDFTVIGTAVNEASRIESLCDQLDRNLLISDSFVSALRDAAVRPDDCELMSLGSHSLRGVSGQREIYGIAEKAPLQDR